MNESVEVQIAKLEGKLDEHFARLEERMDGLEKRLGEKFNGHEGRIAALEQSIKSQGKRLGYLEAGQNKATGGLLASLKLLAAGSVAGAMVIKLMEWMRG